MKRSNLLITASKFCGIFMRQTPGHIVLKFTKLFVGDRRLLGKISLVLFKSLSKIFSLSVSLSISTHTHTCWLAHSQSVPHTQTDGRIMLANGTANFKKCKQLFEYQHLLLFRDIWWSKFYSISKCC